MGLDDRIKELVAVGASISANCQPCLRYHTDKAIEFGANSGDIAEAIKMGEGVRKGAASKMDDFSSSLKNVVPSRPELNIR